MATTAQTTNGLAISQIIYFTDNGANGVGECLCYAPF